MSTPQEDAQKLAQNDALNALLSELPTGAANETPEHRLKRLSMRSMRRGIKEMDIILKKYSDDHLNKMSAEDLDHYERLLAENDQDLYQWVSGQVAAPEQFSVLIEEIATYAGAR